MTPSIWPAVLSAGLALGAFGVPTSPWFSVAGLLLTALALVGWIGEVRHGGEAGHH
jgi:Cytochrome c oxidase subunit IV